NLVSFLKSASSRILRQQFAEQLNQVYWGKAKLWHDSKCIVSCGGAPLEILRLVVAGLGANSQPNVLPKQASPSYWFSTSKRRDPACPDVLAPGCWGDKLGR
ncbi:transposase, partial [Synechococcus sp. H60.3]|uniref:transposase n=1 Tax=Synechococcus sp. H60.3 TaxID=2967124 RepID=UPI0039C0DC38